MRIEHNVELNDDDRVLNESIKIDLKAGGILAPILEAVKQDDTLMLSPRKNTFDLYYRGGRLQNFEKKGDGYRAKIDPGYLVINPIFDGAPKLESLTKILTKSDAEIFALQIPLLKYQMDIHFSQKKDRSEREFAQLVVRENNFSRISNDTEYFLTDYEFQMKSVAGAGGQLDLIGFKWLANDRGASRGSELAPVIIEMKYGIGALSENKAAESVRSSSLLGHLQSLLEVMANKDLDYGARLIKTIERQYNDLKDLELVKIKGKKEIKININSRIEYVFLLANANPRSKLLKDILDSKAYKSVIEGLEEFDVDVKYFVAHFAGYGMHDSCMKSSEEFRALLE